MNSSIPQTARQPIGATTEILLERLIDYAGLFPPASLDMRAAVTNYDAYRRSKYSKMLGRFIVPAARLTEFKEALASLPFTNPTCWELSVLMGSDLAVDVASLNNQDARFSVKSIEAKAAPAEDVRRLSEIIPPEIEAYFEIPLTGGERECIEAIAKCGHRAKIRTGGETPDKFPTCGKIAEFLNLCARAKIPFKATAGLHHPHRSVHNLTYQPDSPTGMMHGFLNVFLAAAFTYVGMETKMAKELLEEQSPAAFRFDSQQISWRDFRLDPRTIATARQNFAISFGSCSFTDPVDDLLLLGLL